MVLEIYREIAGYSPKSFKFFDFQKLDAFHQPEILSVIYGDSWESVLVVANDKAFLHAFSKKQIEDTEWYDIEPLVGYAGPVVNSDDKLFIDRALREYSQLCREQNIVAEVIRFNPLIQNHEQFQKANLIDIVPAKEIVIANCHKDEFRQLKDFKDSTRRNLKNHALKYYRVETYDSSEKKQSFVNFYYQFLDNVGAKAEWYFPKSLFSRAAQSSYFKLVEVYDGDLICSSSLIIDHCLASYYFLGANTIPRLKGAHEMMLFKVCLNSAAHGIGKLILGGGNTSSAEDPLLIYKKKFALDTEIFYIGKIVHNEEIFSLLCEELINRNPEIKNANFFLKYRL